MQTFHGVWPALITPHTVDDEVNVPVLRNIIDYHLDKGIDGFYIGGTTGEGIFMPVHQRKLITETVLAQVNGRVPVIVHAGCVAVADAVDIAIHARDHGAVGISSILPPLYDTTESVIRYFRALAASVSDIAFLPYLLNPNFDTVSLLRELLSIPNLAGTKYTGPNMFEFKALVDLGNASWTMFSGMDEQTLYAVMMGSTGSIGSTLNFMPGVYIKIRQYAAEGKLTEAQTLQERANQITSIMIDHGFPGALKAVMGKLGFECGLPRLPRLPISDEQRAALFAALDQADFDSLVSL